jgi:3-deoxy-manno-octulosonate cytidylyltransferase (CMP-KDO synthetase)
MSSLKSIAIIPARFESTRFPGKPLVTIAHKTMIQHVYERSLQAKSLAEVIVATDDGRILQAVQAFGGQVCMTSPLHRSGTDRVAEVAASNDADVIVNVQGDEPLIDPEALDAVVEPFQSDPSLMISTLSVEGTDGELENPNVVKVVVDHDGFALYFSGHPSRSFVIGLQQWAGNKVLEACRSVCVSAELLGRPCNAAGSYLEKPRHWSNSAFWKMVTASKL